MKPATLEFVKQRFAEYYQRQNLTVPSSLEQREWGGFIFFDPTAEVRMRRHMAFADPLELGAYVKNLVPPAHVYYSTAYYQTPSAPTMNEKHWAGADLIFDLDADQIVRGPYAVMLARVKEETEKLLAMLIDELGFARNQIRIAFSGGGAATISTSPRSPSGGDGGAARSGARSSITSAASGSIRMRCSHRRAARPGGGGATWKRSAPTSRGGLRLATRRKQRLTLRDSTVSGSERPRSSLRISAASPLGAGGSPQEPGRPGDRGRTRL